MLRRGEHAVDAAQNGKGQDHVLILAALEAIADEVGDRPDEADDLTVSVQLSPGAIRNCSQENSTIPPRFQLKRESA